MRLEESPTKPLLSTVHFTLVSVSLLKMLLLILMLPLLSLLCVPLLEFSGVVCRVIIQASAMASHSRILTWERKT